MLGRAVNYAIGIKGFQSDVDGAQPPRHRSPSAVATHGVLRKGRAATMSITPSQSASPANERICERFHKTILNEFYQVASARRSTRR